MQQAYFNTTNETGEQLAMYREQAGAQLKLVRKVIKSGMLEMYTAEQVYELLAAAGEINKQFTPLTSIRARLSTLKKLSEVTITEHKTKGKYSRKIHYYSPIAA